MNVDVMLALGKFEAGELVNFVYTHPSQPTEPVRRVLVTSESARNRLRVSIEAAYQLFEGDYHHIVHSIGFYTAEEPAEVLGALVKTAYELVMSWKPSMASIETTAFLPC